MLSTSVQGGTGAGQAMHRRKFVPEAWTCVRGHLNKGYAIRCLHPGCREKRGK